MPKCDVTTLTNPVNTISGQKAVHAFGICEVFNQKEDHLRHRRQQILEMILTMLNTYAVCSAEQPAETQEIWTGETDQHYIFIWNTNNLNCVNYEVVSCGSDDQPQRRAQYFEFQATS